MQGSEYVQMDATQLAEEIRSGKCSPEEVLRQCEAAVDAMDPQLNAIYYRGFEEGKRQIQTGVDKSAPFAGVPLLVKDSGAMVAGFPYSAGSRLLQGSICSEDTSLTKKFKQAGFILVGSTKTPECCFTNTTESLLHGATRNPWNLQYSTGGSSGGSAAAVASGIVSVAHGNDGGGSIREPASCCGVVGLKPSRFRISGAPDVDDANSGLCTSFALTRSVRDTKRLLMAVNGVDSGYYGTQPPLTEPQAERKLRIAVMKHYPLGGELENAECLNRLEEAERMLRECGYETEEAYPIIDPRIHWARTTLQSAYIVRQLELGAERMGRPINEQYVEETILEAYRRARKVTGESFVEALEVNNRISRSMGAFMEQYDLILCPTMGSLPPHIGEIDANVHTEWDYDTWSREKSRFTHFTNLFNTTGQPSISIPLFESSQGLPIGMELSGRIGEDMLVLHVAEQLETLHPWKYRMPQITKEYINHV